MKLAEIKTVKLLLVFLAEFIVKKANLEAVQNVVAVQKEVNTIKASIALGDDRKVAAALTRLNKLEGGLDRIQRLYKSVSGETAKSCFAKYIA